MCNHIPNDIIPIKWFGDRKAYMNSELKVVTVGLNPSSKEFREKDGRPFTTTLRFRHYQADKPKTLIAALNAYFETRPYRWFNSFENVLNGMCASYYDNAKYPFRALHTDICSPWATTPTWSKLPQNIKETLYADGHRQWVKLIKQLHPDIMIASVAREYIIDLGIENTEKLLCQFDRKNDGTLRNQPVKVFQYKYNDIPLINCSLLCNPHTCLSKEYKNKIGTTIKRRLLRL